MSVGINVQILLDAVYVAYERGDCNAIQRLDERIKMLILDSVVDKDREGLREAVTKLEIARALLPESEDGERRLELHYMLKSNTVLAKLAARRVAPVG